MFGEAADLGNRFLPSSSLRNFLPLVQTLPTSFIYRFSPHKLHSLQ